MMLKSAPVRATALTKAIRLTSRNPRWTVRRRSCTRNGTSAASGRPAARTGLVSGIASQATPEASSDVAAYATNGAARPQWVASSPPGKGPMPTAKMNTPW